MAEVEPFVLAAGEPLACCCLRFGYLEERNILVNRQMKKYEVGKQQ